MKEEHFEIERKYLIRYPDVRMLDEYADKSEITQTYLISPIQGESARVRKRGLDGAYTYTHTQKKRISDIRRIEQERILSEEEYEELLKTADPKRSVIHKLRYCLPFMDQMFEIDLYPFWKDRAVMEIELGDEEQEITFPPFLEILAEVTSDKRYTNASLAKQIPFDSI